MAERIVSPGVFTREIDQSFLAQGIRTIGAAVVGPTVKGPALVPIWSRISQKSITHITSNASSNYSWFNWSFI